MIYCPECGTANRDGSKFCNDCGARLDPDQGKRCPMCAQLNPLDAEVCQHCQARLTPLRLGDAPVIFGEEDDEEEQEEEAPGVFVESELASEGIAPEPTAPEPADWLRRLRQSATGGADEQEPSAVLGDDEEIEDSGAFEWRLGVDEGTEALAEEGFETDTDALPLGTQDGPAPLPDWLEELVASDEGPGDQAGEEQPLPGLGSPSWLQEITADVDESRSEGDAQDEFDAEWPVPAQADASDEVETLGQTEQPDWLLDGEESDLSSADDAYGDLIPEQAPPSEPEQEDSWQVGEADLDSVVTEDDAWSAPEIEFDSSDEPGSLEPEWGLEQSQEPSVMGAGEIPDWLRDLAAPGQSAGDEGMAPVAEGSPSEDAPAGSPALQDDLDADIPDWLRDLAPVQIDDGGDEIDQGLAAAEIPNWLADLRPVPSAVPSIEAEERAEQGQGVLSGIGGILPVESVWRSPQRAQATPMPPIMTAEEQAAELFADILAGQPEERATTASEEPGFVSRGMTRLILYMFLAFAVLVPLFFGADWFSASIQVPDPTWSLWDTVNALPADANVVVAFDYDPSVAAELDLQGVALLRHLLEKKARVYALGMVPQGPALAQRVWDTVSTGTGSEYGRDFINLGYLSGQEAGLRKLAEGLGAAFTQDFFQRRLAGSAMMQRVPQLTDVSLIVVLSADKPSVVRWLEQVQRGYPVKMVAGVAASAGPAVLPYHHTGQLSGLLIGMPGAAEYEITMNQPHTAVASLGAQSLAHLAIIFVILLGNLTALGNRMRQRK